MTTWIVEVFTTVIKVDIIVFGAMTKHQFLRGFVVEVLQDDQDGYHAGYA